MLDRLIRGRSWIALVAFALIGIVTLQLGLLKLNAGIGRSLQRESVLQRENAALSIENSELAAGDVVESSAGRLGMEVVPVGSLRFLTARPGGDANRAAAKLAAPVASAPAASQTAEGSGGGSGGAQSAEASAAGSGATGSSGAEVTRQSGETSSTSGSSEPEPREAAAGAGESRAPRASAEQPGEHAGASPAPAGGATEASGGTQAGTPGR